MSEILHKFQLLQILLKLCIDNYINYKSVVNVKNHWLLNYIRWCKRFCIKFTKLPLNVYYKVLCAKKGKKVKKWGSSHDFLAKTIFLKVWTEVPAGPWDLLRRLWGHNYFLNNKMLLFFHSVDICITGAKEVTGDTAGAVLWISTGSLLCLWTGHSKVRPFTWQCSAWNDKIMSSTKSRCLRSPSC